MKFSAIVDSLQEDLARVDARVRRAAEVEYPVLGEILSAIVSSGGKRLRPVLLLLAARAYDYDIEPLIPAAAGVEMLHTASLVHDDTIDRALLRRGQPTLNSVFNSGTVILIGDYLFAQSAILAAETMNPRVVSVFASTLADICDGQLREIFTAHRIDQTREDYERRIYGKTASLFAGAAEMGALIGNADESAVTALRAFGADVGMAFQIVDDVLDLQASTDTIGKPANLDLRQGTVTLPTMLYLSRVNGDDSHVQRVVDGNGVTDEEYSRVATLIQESGAIEEAMDAARSYVDRAVARLSIIPDREVQQQLEAFANLALHRGY
ncbi:MAG: polyprenyl synthetase family protein [Chloroflexi bacterium]|nr:MAG: polyprenyl synthetase family protein [Chloroflexota bacterium]